MPPTIFISYRVMDRYSQFDNGMAPSQNGSVFIHKHIESQYESVLDSPELLSVLHVDGVTSFDTPIFSNYSDIAGTGGNVRVVLRHVLGGQAVIDLCRITAATECSEGTAACSDGVDQDCDGLVDGDDPDCGEKTLSYGSTVPPWHVRLHVFLCFCTLLTSS